MNGTGNDKRNSAKSVPVYQLVGKDGFHGGLFRRRADAAEAANRLWPGQEQGDDTWDVHVVGVK